MRAVQYFQHSKYPKAFILIGAFFMFAFSIANAQVLDTNKLQTDISLNEYLIGIGDVLDIRVYNRPQLSRDAIRVDGRGMIRMPLLGTEIRAKCRTDYELAQEISRLYLEYLRTPHVEVFIKDFQSKPVAVIGAVREPGRFQLQRKVRLLELLSFAGGPTDDAGGRIQIKHDSNTRSCELENSGENPVESVVATASSENVTWYQIKDLMKSGDAEADNPFVLPGDVVNLIEADKIYIVGNVYKPTTIALKEQITITQAIAMAGGTLPDTSFDKVRISRQALGETTKTEILVNLKAVSQKKAEDVVLQANDIIEVPSSTGKKILRGLINSIVPTISRLPIRVIN